MLSTIQIFKVHKEQHNELIHKNNIIHNDNCTKFQYFSAGEEKESCTLTKYKCNQYLQIVTIYMVNPSQIIAYV